MRVADCVFGGGEAAVCGFVGEGGGEERGAGDEEEGLDAHFGGYDGWDSW